MIKTAILALLSLLVLPSPAARLAPVPKPGPSLAQSRAAAPIRGAMHNFTLATPPVPAPTVTFQDPSGKDTAFEAFRGKVVLVNVWATWCGPCIEEMPTLAALRQARRGQDFMLVELSEDRGGAATVQNFFARHDFGLTSYLDPHNHVTDTLGLNALPTTLLLDRDGNILGSLRGTTDWSGPDAAALIDWALNQKRPDLPAAQPIALRQPSRLPISSSGPSSVSTR